jgi:hypothetical protein
MNLILFLKSIFHKKNKTTTKNVMKKGLMILWNVKSKNALL